MWSIIAKSLGQKSGKNKHQSDIIAFLRLLFVLQIIITNGFIVAGVIRHFNDVQYQEKLK
jgi:hypothetical protein